MPVGTVGSVKGVHFEELRQQVSSMDLALSKLVPNYTAFVENSKKSVAQPLSFTKDQTKSEPDHRVIYYDITRDQMLQAIDLAAQELKAKGVDLNKNSFFTKMNSDPDFKEKYMNRVQTLMKKEIDARFKQDQQSGASVTRF